MRTNYYFHFVQVSGFVSEQFGFGMPLTRDQLYKVNRWRKEKMGPNPSDEMKKRYAPLTESPALRFLKYGKNRDGWWNYEMMAQQCEGRTSRQQYEYDMHVVM